MLYISEKTQAVINRILQAVVLVYQAVAVVVFIATFKSLALTSKVNATTAKIVIKETKIAFDFIFLDFILI